MDRFTEEAMEITRRWIGENTTVKAERIAAWGRKLVAEEQAKHEAFLKANSKNIDHMMLEQHRMLLVCQEAGRRIKELESQIPVVRIVDRTTGE